MDYYNKARNFIFRNARPLDMARWKYLFEANDRESVLECLKAYQNPDGGFANALEPDSWNKESSPLQTWVATKIIREVNLVDKSHPLIGSILSYLDSGHNFNGQMWNGLNSLKSNNDYPHAPWWSYIKEEEKSYNPTASLIGFILKYAEKDSNIYNLACKLALEAYSYFKENYPLKSMHEVSCFVEMYEYMKEAGIFNLFDLNRFRDLLDRQIQKLITYDTSSWDIDYVCKPSIFIPNKESDFYSSNKDICDYECNYIINNQKEDGTWNVTWSWDAYSREWSISENWWKSDIIIRNIKFVKEFSSQI